MYLEVGDVKYSCETAFSYDIAKFGYGVLGQVGFFDHFSVEFNYQKGLIKVRKL